jgi:hypothetical protein
MQRGQDRKASVTGPPTGSSSAGLMTGMPPGLAGRAVVARAGAAEARGGEAAIGPGLEVDQLPRAVAARAVDMQLKAVLADVAYRLEWKRAEHSANRNSAACPQSLRQQ